MPVTNSAASEHRNRIIAFQPFLPHQPPLGKAGDLFLARLGIEPGHPLIAVRI